MEFVESLHLFYIYIYIYIIIIIIIIIIIVCLIKTSSGSQKTELHDVKCYKVINSKKIRYYNAI